MESNQQSIDRRCRWLIALTVFLSVAYFYQSGMDNENSHFCQLRSLYDRGEWFIGDCNYRTADVIEFGGHVYPNKTPGMTYLTYPIWWVWQHVLGPLQANPAARNEWAACLTSLCSVGLASVLLSLMMFSVLREMGYTPRISAWLSLGVSLGTILFPFSTLFFSHLLTVTVAFAAFFALFSLRLKMEQRWPMAAFAGVLLGYIPCIDYPGAICSGLIGLYGLFALRSWRLRAVLIIGSLAGVAPLLWYNWAIFGKPLFVTYAAYANDEAHNAFFPEHRRGLLGFSLPKLSLLYLITFGSQRGLLFINPWLTIAALGAVFGLIRRHAPYRREALLSIAVCVAFLAMNASYGSTISFWGGGASTGPRHCTPAIPFAVILTAAAIAGSPLLQRLTWLAGWFSAGAMLLATAVEPRVGYDFTNPLRHLFWRNYLLGRFALHHRGVFSNTPLLDTVGAWNLGSLFHLPGYFQLLPLLCVWSVAAWQLCRILRSADTPPRLLLLERASALLPLAFGLIPYITAMNQTGCGSGHGNGFRAQMLAGLPFAVPPGSFSDALVPSSLVVETRYDSNIAFDWPNGDLPLESPCTIVWSSNLKLEEGGYYRIGTTSDDGSAVYVDGSLVLSNWGVHGPRTVEVPIALSSGTHRLDVIYYNDRFGGSMRLFWTPPGGGSEAIPEQLLAHECSNSEAPAPPPK